MDSSPSTTRIKAYEKSAEFARLYYFFEKLTQPRSRGADQTQESTSREETSTAASAADPPFPEDIAPLLKNLSAILTKDDEPMDGDAPLEASEAQVSIPETPTTALASTFAATPRLPTHSRSISVSFDHASMRPRRNTVAVSGGPPTPTRPPGNLNARRTMYVDRRDSDQPRFPLKEKRYPFTFKLLLHKLYDLEDWAAKVQEVLAASQEQFRSLSSTPPRAGNADGCGPRSSSSPSTTTFSGSLFGTTLDSPSPSAARRRRAQSTSKGKANNNNDANTSSAPAQLELALPCR